MEQPLQELRKSKVFENTTTSPNFSVILITTRLHEMDTERATRKMELEKL